LLIGNPQKAKEKLRWEAKTKLEELVQIMVNFDLKKVVEKGY
jgi:GDPmannose 4,6-dehydratase